MMEAPAQAIFRRIMETPEPAQPRIYRHDNEDPMLCTACLERGGGDNS